jgi:hypothetical protein
MQLVLPAWVWYLPGAQSLQSLVFCLAYFPGGHLRQKLWSDTSPALQSVQAKASNLEPGPQVNVDVPTTLLPAPCGLVFSEIWHCWQTNFELPAMNTAPAVFTAELPFIEVAETPSWVPDAIEIAPPYP